MARSFVKGRPSNDRYLRKQEERKGQLRSCGGYSLPTPCHLANCHIE